MLGINELILFVVMLFANGIQAITGFAGTLLAMPPAIKLIGADDARIVLNIIAQISCLAIVVSGYKNINWKEFAKMLILMSAGMVLGMVIYSKYPTDYLLTIYGIVIIIIALARIFVHKKFELPMVCMLLVILMAGIIHGMFVSGGALLVVYASTKMKDKNEMRVTMALIWLVIGFFLSGNQLLTGQMTEYDWLLIVIGVIPVIIGTYVGVKIVNAVSVSLFMKITNILVLLSGIMILI